MRATTRIPTLLAVLVALVATGCGGSDDSSRPAQRDEPAVVWAVGDGADGSERAKALARRIASDDPDRFLYLGDVYDLGTAEEYRRNYHAVYGELADVTAPTPGNHEWHHRAEGYNPYWREQLGRPQPPWYEFELAGWEIISLNSEAPNDPGSPQLRWLEAAVREPAGTCRLAFWHRPRWSAGTVHPDDPDMDPFWDTLRGHARIVVTAHDHNSQRFPPFEGMVQFVAGAGGHLPYPLDEDDRRLAFGLADRDAALRLELEPGRARYAFIATDGERLDSGEVSCERAP